MGRASCTTTNAQALFQKYHYAGRNNQLFIDSDISFLNLEYYRKGYSSFSYYSAA